MKTRRPHPGKIPGIMISSVPIPEHPGGVLQPVRFTGGKGSGAITSHDLMRYSPPRTGVDQDKKKAIDRFIIR